MGQGHVDKPDLGRVSQVTLGSEASSFWTRVLRLAAHLRTIGGESRDQVAVNYIMGHAPPDSDMASVYRERISDERLKAVVDHVHQWLFGDDPETAKPEENTGSGGTAATAK